jgi:hypothetical protein
MDYKTRDDVISTGSYAIEQTFLILGGGLVAFLLLTDYILLLYNPALIEFV